MTTLVRRLTVPAAVLFLIARGASAQDAVPITRLSEPVVVSGAQLAPLHGVPTDRVGVWVWREDESRVPPGAWERLASQVDQRDADGAFVASEGGSGFDATDEIVFMADALGVVAVTPEAIAEAAPDGVVAGSAWAQITVTDPLESSAAGYAYVFESPAHSPAPLVEYDAATRVIHSAAYTIGLATTEIDGYIGLKSLSLRGDPRNRIDRTKIRVSVPTIGDFNEESLGLLGGLPPLEPIIQGPIRLIMDPTGNAVAYAARASLFGIELGQEIPPIPGLEFRVSLDLSPNASGATYRDAFSLRDITIDGAPDTVQQLLLPRWREIAFEEGRLVTLATGEPTPLLVRNYYKDDAAPDTLDTGDQMSYGDSGVSASSFGELAAVGFLGQMVAVSPEDPLTAANLAEQLANPLQIEVALSSRAIYLPWLHQNGAR
jgi:hypothetical protein